MIEQINLDAVANALIMLVLVIVVPHIYYPIAKKIFRETADLDSGFAKWFIGLIGIIVSICVILEAGFICCGLYQIGLSLTNAGVKLW